MTDKLLEAHLNRADTNAIFKNAAGLKRGLRGLYKDKVNINDLQQAWKDAGFPDDTRDIASILKDHGFGDKEVKKVFSQVFGGGEEEPEEPVATPAIQKIADYAKKNGFADELKAFLEKEYGEELGIEGPEQKGIFGKAKQIFKKAVAEDVRQIFSLIIQEERTERTRLIREDEQAHLGRSKKSPSRLEEISLGDALKANQYIKLLHSLKAKHDTKIEISHIKNQIIQSWRSGMKSRKHYDKLLSKIDLSLNDLIDK